MPPSSDRACVRAWRTNVCAGSRCTCTFLTPNLPLPPPPRMLVSCMDPPPPSSLHSFTRGGTSDSKCTACGAIVGSLAFRARRVLAYPPPTHLIILSTHLHPPVIPFRSPGSDLFLFHPTDFLHTHMQAVAWTVVDRIHTYSVQEQGDRPTSPRVYPPPHLLHTHAARHVRSRGRGAGSE
jgi:hypothetical protein